MFVHISLICKLYKGILKDKHNLICLKQFYKVKSIFIFKYEN